MTFAILFALFANIAAAASNVDGVAFLIERRDEMLATGAYPLSEYLYYWRGGAWVDSTD